MLNALSARKRAIVKRTETIVRVPLLIYAAIPAGMAWHAAAENVENINAIRAKVVAVAGMLLSERAMKTLPYCKPLRPDMPAGLPPPPDAKFDCVPRPDEQPAVPGPRSAVPPDDDPLDGTQSAPRTET